MGTQNRSVIVGRLTAAIMLMAGTANSQDFGIRAGELPDAMIGNAIYNEIKYHHRGIRSSRKSGAAAIKRASRKRRNVLKHKAARRG